VAPKSIRLRLADVRKDAALHLQSSSVDADPVSQVVDLNKLSDEDVRIETFQGRFADQTPRAGLRHQLSATGPST
jgi:hypothetical protein